MTAPLPEGWRISLDPRGRWLRDGRSVLTPTGRLLRLGPAGPAALVDLQLGRGSAVQRQLAATLVQGGAAHPHPPPHPATDVTVVVPAHDRLSSLERCLGALAGHDVLVVDDGSQDESGVAALCVRHGARLVRRANGGPAAARNTALPLLVRPFVAFLDSDCVPSTGWLEHLRGHLEDPQVGAVAPRVVGSTRSPLDLGRRPAQVRPGGSVAYVPTAALLVRRSALTAFDEDLRFGEDVDLVWRTVDAGWSVRYDPSVAVAHEEPATVTARLARRFRYGTSAAPLAERHGDRLAHLVLPPWPTAVLALLLTGHPLLAAATAAEAARRLDRTLDDPRASAAVIAQAVGGTALGVGRALALLGPLAWVAAARDRRVAALLLLPLLTTSGRTTGLVGQAAYGAGVLVGCARGRTVVPLLPRRR